MANVVRRFEQARRALQSLNEVLAMPPSAVVRDAAIQRFEYSVETTWKFAQAALQAAEQLELASPRAVVRACHERGIINEFNVRMLFAALDDRNLTVHTYDEALAAEIFERLPKHAFHLRAWQDGIADYGEREGVPLE